MMMIGIEKMVLVLVLVLVSEKIGFEKSIGIGFENFWYRKKYRYRFRKILVSKKVSDSVSKNFGIGKKFRFRSDFWFRHSLVINLLLVKMSTYCFMILNERLKLFSSNIFLYDCSRLRARCIKFGL